MDAIILGTRVDVLDDDGVWNPARILKCEERKIYVRYDNWGEKFDEWVKFSINRVVPIHTYTVPVKCWAKIEGMPWWPGIASIRLPGNKRGIEYLRLEPNINITVFDNLDPKKFTRGWMNPSQFKMLDSNNQRRKSEMEATNFHKGIKIFRKALRWLGSSTAIQTFPEFDQGSLPKGYLKKVLKQNKVMETLYQDFGMEGWLQEIKNAEELAKQRDGMIVLDDFDLSDLALSSKSESGEDNDSNGDIDEASDAESNSGAISEEEEIANDPNRKQKKLRTKRRPATCDNDFQKEVQQQQNPQPQSSPGSASQNGPVEEEQSQTESRGVACTPKKKTFDTILKLGDMIDAMDKEGIWNIATVVQLQESHAKIEYLGWDREWDEWLSVHSNRIAPVTTYTSFAKCFAQHPQFPFWPAMVVIRYPGTKQGEISLKEEPKLFVEFMDNRDSSKRSRCWLDKHRIVSYSKGLKSAERYMKSTRSRQKQDMKDDLHLLKSCSISEDFPGFKNGTLPNDNDARYKHRTQSLEIYRDELGPSGWRKLFDEQIEIMRATKKVHARVVKSKKRDSAASSSASPSENRDVKRKRVNSSASSRHHTRERGSLKRTHLRVARRSKQPVVETSSRTIPSQDHNVVTPKSAQSKKQKGTVAIRNVVNLFNTEQTSKDNGIPSDDEIRENIKRNDGGKDIDKKTDYVSSSSEIDPSSANDGGDESDEGDFAEEPQLGSKVSLFSSAKMQSMMQRQTKPRAARRTCPVPTSIRCESLDETFMNEEVKESPVLTSATVAMIADDEDDESGEKLLEILSGPSDVHVTSSNGVKEAQIVKKPLENSHISENPRSLSASSILSQADKETEKLLSERNGIMEIISKENDRLEDLDNKALAAESTLEIPKGAQNEGIHGSDIEVEREVRGSISKRSPSSLISFTSLCSCEDSVRGVEEPKCSCTDAILGLSSKELQDWRWEISLKELIDRGQRNECKPYSYTHLPFRMRWLTEKQRSAVHSIPGRVKIEYENPADRGFISEDEDEDDTTESRKNNTISNPRSTGNSDLDGNVRRVTTSGETNSVGEEWKEVELWRVIEKVA